MHNLSTSSKIYIAKSKIKGAGRGVFAKVNITKGELIEKCPLVEIPKKDNSLLVESILVSYFFFLGKRKEIPVLALGFGSIYNHSIKPNAKYKDKLKEKAMDFVAIMNIKKGEEITVNYNPNSKSKHPLWFKVAT